MQYGSWQVGARDQTARKDVRYVRLRLDTGSHQALFFNGPVMEILTPDEFAIHGRFHELGPDLLHEGFDTATAVARIQHDTREIALVVTDQRVVAGIGNIYKSEGLFLARIHPQTLASAVTTPELNAFFATLIPLMRTGRIHEGPVITLPDELKNDVLARTWVYRRRGKPCFVCATPVAMVRQGDLRRMSFYCPSCQHVARR